MNLCLFHAMKLLKDSKTLLLLVIYSVGASRGLKIEAPKGIILLASSCPPPEKEQVRGTCIVGYTRIMTVEYNEGFRS